MCSVNSTAEYPSISNSSLPPNSHSTFSYPSAEVRFYVKTVVIPAILTFGVVGNLLNLFLFVHRSYGRRRLETLERAAFAGLVALAVSDLLFCVVGIPPAFLARWEPGWPSTFGAMVAYYYRMYQEGFRNLFLFTSTWIIVVISAERFVAVYYPMRARWYLKVRNSVAVYVAITVFGVLLSLPLFVKYRTVISTECYSGCMCLHVAPTSLFRDPMFKTAYHVIWSAFGTFIPLVALCLANAGLVLVLYRSRRRNLTNPERYGCSRVTLTVTAIVSSFLVLVCPSMVLYSLDLIFAISQDNSRSFLIAMDATNLTQAVKFASNFILYCGTIRQFRQSLNQMADCNRHQNSHAQESLRSNTKSRPSVF